MPLPNPTRTDRVGLKFLEYYKPHAVWHPGTDFNWGPLPNSDKGQPVTSPASGVVAYASPKGTNGGLGNYCVVYHPKLAVWTRYLHLDAIAVRPAQIVSQGQLLGHLGNSGPSTAHLHFEVVNAKGFEWVKNWHRPYGRYPSGLGKKEVASMWIDPVKWLKENTESPPLPPTEAGKEGRERAEKRKAARLGRQVK
jgi:murein DD-endopeptidase MepM/ murein hydrolase activator NlpD